MNVAVLLAGGVGNRVGEKVPKQFIEVMGKPIIVYTLEKLQNHPDIDAIEVVCIESYVDTVCSYIEEYRITKLKWVICGGNTFQESVRNGVFFLKPYCRPEDILMLHMSISPMVSSEIITDAIEVCRKYGSGISADPCNLCMCKVTGPGCSNEYVDRESLMGLNMPQSFRYGKILSAYEKADGNLDCNIDPHTSSLMFELGETLHFSMGSPMNIKITTREDIDLFEGHLLLQKAREEKPRKK